MQREQARCHRPQHIHKADITRGQNNREVDHGIQLIGSKRLGMSCHGLSEAISGQVSFQSYTYGG